MNPDQTPLPVHFPQHTEPPQGIPVVHQDHSKRLMKAIRTLSKVKPAKSRGTKAVQSKQTITIKKRRQFW